jgi:PAS domain S-box-containing protein
MEQHAILDSDPVAVETLTEVRCEEALLKMSEQIQVLIVEDNPADAELLLRELRRAQFDPKWQRVETEADYLSSLRPDLDLILSDFEMPEFNGLRALELLKERGCDIPFIMVSGTIGEDTAVAAIKQGAADYLMKDRLARLGTAVGHTLEQTRLRRQSRQTEKALAESEVKFRVLFEVAYDAIFISHQGVFVDCNARGLELFGLPREQIIGQPVFLGSPPTQPDGSDPKEKTRELLKVVEAGVPQSFEWLLTRPDGTQVYSDINLGRFEQGGKVYVQAIARDITERKRAEEALLKAGALQNAIFNSANFSSIATDEKGVIQIFNVGAERMLGYTAAEVMNKITPAEISDPQEVITRAKALSLELDTTIAPGFEALVFKASRGIEDVYELTYIRKDGSRFPAVVSVTALRDAQNGVIGYLLIGTDNTARQQVEEVRKRFEHALQESNVELETAKSTAEKANLAKSEFLSSMSHELRSPLNAILGFAQLMESASPSPTASQTKSIAQILQAGWYLLKLINEILDLSGIESGQVSLSKEMVSLSDLMSECRAMMEPQAQQRGIHMTFPQFDAPLYVKADMTRLKQIVINLLSNAIKYNREGGKVVVDCTVNVADRIRISVKDTGEGLSPEKLAQLFQPFNRLGQEASGVTGTGIGLVVTKRLAELMDGVIGVESTVGMGSVFWCEMDSAEAFQLDVQRVKAETVALPRISARGVKHTLLYVEDNPANMNLIEQLIERLPDIRLLTAVNGTLGIELARSTLPQVILMDVNLPGISGIKALQILREDPAMAHIPVVALSANAMPRDIAKGLEMGFFRYLTKPIKVKEFMITLNAALEFAEKNPGQACNAELIA